ncbi:MAG TPA: IPT/TIG domain-containing protein [Bryobacteraceae bacterium]|nr:IPT/TIG domain-containing protein [Bryobacteraceae bacterium]
MLGRILLPLLAATIACGQTINTFAGNGTAGYSGDGGPATQAEINRVVGLATDAAGNIYLADQNNNRVRRVDTKGVITTFAGTGAAGYSGDGGPAAQAELSGPLGVCVAPSGAIYVNDYGNERIREISTSGIITTVAGNGSTGNSGDGGPATAAEFVIPIRCAVDLSGNLFIVDQGAFRVRKVDSSGTITAYAGTGAQGFSGDGGPATQAEMNNPTWVTVDAAGNLYVTDQFNFRIRLINAASGTITTVAGNGDNAFAGDGGPATQASLGYPGGTVVDPTGALFIVDGSNNRIREVSGGVITTVAGTGPAGYTGDGGAPLQAELNSPFPITLDSAGNLYVGDGDYPSDATDNRVRVISDVAAPLTKQTPTIGAVVSASDFGEFASTSPGAWIEIYGSNLAVGSGTWAGADFNGVNAPTSVDGTAVSVGGQAAFIDFISPGQVNALVPSNVATGMQPVTVTVGSLTSAAYNIAVNPVEPGLDAPPSFNIGGMQYAVALFADGTFVLPVGAIAGVTSRPAQPNDEIVLYGIGFGPVTPNIPAGQLVQQANTLASSFQMSIGGIPVTNVFYYGLAPNYTGLYQFNVVVPANAGTGAVPLTFTVGGGAGTQTLYLAVSN